jgi:prepilin-type processing-associated H-X9-DG protein
VALLVNGKEAGVTDYSTPSEVSSTAAIKINRGNKVIRGAIVSYEHASAALIRDVLSNTLMLWEDAGRPNHYVSGRKLGPVEVDTKCENANVTSGFVFGGAWADENNFTPIHGFSADGTSCELGQGTRCPMNCTNNNEAYAFHPQGMVVAFCDGSVRPIHDSITLELMAALITRAGREVVDHESF